MNFLDKKIHFRWFLQQFPMLVKTFKLILKNLNKQFLKDYAILEEEQLCLLQQELFLFSTSLYKNFFLHVFWHAELVTSHWRNLIKKANLRQFRKNSKTKNAIIFSLGEENRSTNIRQHRGTWLCHLNRSRMRLRKVHKTSEQHEGFINVTILIFLKTE